MTPSAGELLEGLRALLSALVALALDERERMRSLDAGALLLSASRREGLHEKINSLTEALRAERARVPAADPEVTQGLAAVRVLAADLRTAELLNQELATRSLSLVRGLLRTLTPQAASYDRRGAGLTEVRSTLQSTRA